MRFLCLSTVVISVLVADAALAASCEDEIQLVAEQYDLSPELPVNRPGIGNNTASPEGLARGDAVVPSAPPPDRSADGPRSASPAPRSSPPADGSAATPAELDAAQRTRMQALLQAAQAARLQGDSEKCFDYVSRARAVSPPG